MFVLVTANYGSSNLYQTYLRISSVDRLAQTASLETASQLCVDISVRLNKVDYTTGGNPRRHREKMATSTNICILASSKWRDISKKKKQPGPGRCMRGGRKATFQKEVCVSYWGSTWKSKDEVMLKVCLVRQVSHQGLVMWNSPVQTPPSLTQQTITHNDFSCCNVQFETSRCPADMCWLIKINLPASLNMWPGVNRRIMQMLSDIHKAPWLPG